jgi:AAA+ superfamily predicted ATPase
MCFNKIRSEVVAIYFSCIDENGKRSDQKTLSNTTKVDHVVGSDQAKKRFSVLIQILKYYKSPNQNVLELQIIPELKNGTEYS